jgi:hypothetical protein
MASSVDTPKWLALSSREVDVLDVGRARPTDLMFVSDTPDAALGWHHSRDQESAIPLTWAQTEDYREWCRESGIACQFLLA